MAKLQSVLEQQAEKDSVYGGLPSLNTTFSSYIDILSLVYGPDAPYVAQILDNPNTDQKLSTSVKNVLNTVQNYVTAYKQNASGMSPKTTGNVTQAIKDAVNKAVTPALDYEASLQAQLNNSQLTQQQLQLEMKGNDVRLQAAQKAIDDSNEKIAAIDKQISSGNLATEGKAVAAIRQNFKNLANQGFADTGSISQYNKSKGRTVTQDDTSSYGQLKKQAVDIGNQYGIHPAIMLGMLAAEGKDQGLGASRNNFYNMGAVDANPNQASGFPTTQAGIEAFAKFISGQADTSIYANGSQAKQAYAEAYAKYKNNPDQYLQAIEQNGYAGDPSTYNQRSDNGYSSYSSFVKDTPEWGQGMLYGNNNASKQQTNQPQSTNVFQTLFQPAYAASSTMQNALSFSPTNPPMTKVPQTQTFTPQISTNQGVKTYGAPSTQSVSRPSTSSGGGGGGGGGGSWGTPTSTPISRAVSTPAPTYSAPAQRQSYQTPAYQAPQSRQQYSTPAPPQYSTPAPKPASSSKGNTNIVNSIISAIKNLFGK